MGTVDQALGNHAGRSVIALPDRPSDQRDRRVAVWSEPVLIDTYMPMPPSPYPAFLDRRVYQGSSGKVYPLPFHERIEAIKRPRLWHALHLENEWVRLVILPELGGRIHIAYDRTALYDFFYRNNVIKPALVGLAGPWVSGGVEFNWPQHHRPATFLPVDWHIECEGDGSATIWCSDHDPMTRMKGMHGIRVRPESSVIEARVRLYNRTDEPQTFLWWANAAAAVNDDYQSFFPTDVRTVADHAKRAVATFPAVRGSYYGIDYPARRTTERPDGDRLDWYRNIPVPTSYMVVSTDDDFFGGYDHGKQAGFVHWADHRIAPGKKQWTWGNAPFGWAWDANLTDGDGPYVELMAGVYTDNQPDFSWLAPGETKAFSQFWYPIQKIGPAHQANLDAAVRLDVEPSGSGTAIRAAVAVTRRTSVRVLLRAAAKAGSPDAPLFIAQAELAPDRPYIRELQLPGRIQPEDVTLVVSSGDDTIMEWTHRAAASLTPELRLAAAPPPPADVRSNDELYLDGMYLAQYRHATRSPEPYWREAVSRDAGDYRSLLALAGRYDATGRFAEAEEAARAALDRLTSRVPSPHDGEAHYRLGLILAHSGRDGEAATLLAKAQWSAAWRVPAAFELARLHGRAREWSRAEEVLRGILRLDREHLQARDLLASILMATGRTQEAQVLAAETLGFDPLDQWARDIAARELTSDAPTLLDIALEYSGAGLDGDALRVLDLATVAVPNTPIGQVNVGPLIEYHRAAIRMARGLGSEAAKGRRRAQTCNGDHCLASRLVDVAALDSALKADPSDSRAGLLLGNWYYDRGRFGDAIGAWRQAVVGRGDSETLAIAHRNLGIASYNVLQEPEAAVRHYERARDHAPGSAQLVHEFDQLLERTGAPDARRLALHAANSALILERDDSVVVHVRLLVRAGRASEARDLILARRFQPWEGGEGEVLAAWEETMKSLARESSAADAVALLRAAIDPPATLGEARHVLANASDLHLLLGIALREIGQLDDANDHLEIAARASGDFLGMSPQPFSEQTPFTIRALVALERREDARNLAVQFQDYLSHLEDQPAEVDFFATSLPTMLLFHDDPAILRARRRGVLQAALDEVASLLV